MRYGTTLYTILEELYPVNIGKLGLIAGIETLGRKVSSYHGIPVDLDCPDGEVPVDEVLSHDIYLIISEAINNAIRHADPSHIKVVVRFDHEKITLNITNDGVSSKRTGQEGPLEGGRGLTIMEYRTVSHGGIISAQYIPHGSFSVYAEIPVVRQVRNEAEAAHDNSHDA